MGQFSCQSRKWMTQAAVWCFFLPACLEPATAADLPVRAYTTADGLARDEVNRIRVDSRGYVWMCTDNGLSRFEGYQFVTYGKEYGLPHLWVNDILESDSDYFIATARGLCRMPKHGRSFASAPIGTPEQRVNFTVLLRDHRGTI